MDKKYYLAIDVGASSGRAILGSFDGYKIGLKEVHRFGNGPIEAAGSLYWDILNIYRECCAGLALAKKKCPKIESVALDTWGLDFGLIGKNGRLSSNPLSYRDPGKYIDNRGRFYEMVPRERLFGITGINPIYTMVPLFYLYGMRLGRQSELGYAAKFLMMPDLLNYFFTGSFCSEFTIANNTMLLDWKTKTWDSYLLGKLGLKKSLFPDIVVSGKKIGNLARKVCTQLGVDSLPVIAAASHDTTSAVAGLPVFKKRWAFISAGTWCVIGIQTEDPLLDTRLLPTAITNEGAAEGKNLIAKNLTGFWILEKCRQRWAMDYGNLLGWGKLAEMAKEAGPFNAFIDIDDQIFSQNHDNMPGLIRDYCARTKQKKPEDIAEVTRCIYESMVLRFKFDLDLIAELGGTEVDLIHLIGGGAKNPLVCQWTSNLTGIPVAAGPVETTSMGNLLMQLKASGEIKSIEEGREISFNSSNILIYEPRDRNRWKEAFDDYVQIVKNN